MCKFKREERYIVVKIKDLAQHQIESFTGLLTEKKIPTRKCVVVESDWPEYESVCKMIEARVTERQGEDPSVLYRPKLSIEGNLWCALYGEDLQNGVAGFGKSPADAMADFNREWVAELTDNTHHCGQDAPQDDRVGSEKCGS